MTEQEEFEFRARMEAESAAPASPGIKSVAELPKKPGFLGGIAQAGGDALGGAVRGAGSIGATLLWPYDAARDAIKGDRKRGVESLITGQAPESRNAQRRRSMDEGLREMGVDTDSLTFKGTKLAGEIAGTAGAGGLAGNALLRGAPLLARAGVSAPAIRNIATAARTGGFRAGTATGAAAIAARATGGGISGFASAGLADPNSAGIGAGIGMALPGALQLAGKAATAIGSGVRSLAAPKSSRTARTVLDAAEISAPADIASLRAGLAQQGPSMIPGSLPTVPMLMQSPGVAQLQRTVENFGAKALPAREAANNAARIAALNRISPVTGTLQQSAENMGNMTQRFARSAEDDATENVRRLYEGVDPEGKGRILLPLDDMQAAKDQFLGRGTFGSGEKAEKALSTARSIGTETIADVKPMSTKGMQDLVLAVRAAGGINTSSKSGRELAGEIRNLRESGLNNIVRPNKGVSVERMAEKMHEAGYLPDNDPASLLDLLQQSAGGNKVFASNADDAYRAALEASQGTPPPGGTFAIPVPFNELQNLRSSIGEAAEQASMKGANRENAALSKMIGEIDSRVNRAGGGSLEPGEFFPVEMASRWRTANAGHADKMARFHTGPQQSMFRKGGDGLPSAQGAELAGKFFNAARSQADDAKAFKRLAGDNEPVIASLKNYAITDLAGQTDKFGRLNNLNYNNWADGRSGAIRELFDSGERSLIGRVGQEVKAADLGATTGMARGSNTMQNAANALDLGLLDSKIINGLANQIPVLGRFTGPALDGLRQTAKRGKASELDELLADPLKLEAALGEYLRLMQPSRLSVKTRGLLDSTSPTAYRVAPLLSTDQ